MTNYRISDNPSETYGNCKAVDNAGAPKLELGQAYVPYQKFEQIYPADKALMSGTVFAELDKPWKKR